MLPPDTNGDVGRNHYVQWVNLVLAVYNKSGTLVLGPLAGNSLWAGFGGLCETTNEGDPIVLYDALADRWVLSQFAFATGLSGNPTAPFVQCIAVSTTGDPTGSYYRYAFTMPDGHFNDYPKLGVWHDAYYMTDVQFIPPAFTFGGTGAFAFKRDAMLNGEPASGVYFNLSTAFGPMLPTDHDGLRPPPPGAPNRFVQFNDDAWGYPQDELELWDFHVDWTTPSNSTFTFVDTLATAAFDSALCGYAADCIFQPGTTERLDAISDRVMHRFAYRNFATHESYVVNHSVDVGGDVAGVRWYELRNPGGSPTIFQQGTYAPADGLSRWMGSVAMDGSGNLAVGYSASSSSAFPSIRYAGRLTGDPLGTLAQGEAVLQAGGGSQEHPASRWGDYSMMSVDPTDDCTFWYTSEYYSATSSADWKTRIGKFKFAECTPPPSCDGQTATLLGTPGNDMLVATISNDVVIAGDGHDQVVGRDGDDRVCAGGGNDLVHGNAGADVLQGGNGDDALNGGTEDDNLDGGAGNDTLRGMLGNDTLAGGPGAGDWVVFLEAPGAVNANLLTGAATGQGTDTLSGIEALQGSAFNDTLIGDGQNNALRGEGGTDTLIGNDGDDSLLGGVGDDNATLDGGPGNDYLSGGDGVDKLLGGTGNDFLFGDGGDDGGATGLLDGGEGNDYLWGGGGADKLVGGADFDFLSGEAGVDELDGGLGHDHLNGGPDNDSLTGGTGNDWVNYEFATGPVAVDLSASPGTGSGAGVGTDTLVGVELVVGSAFDDTITGNAAGNILRGGNGNDTLTGNDGDDILVGGPGDDISSLDGGPGNDVLFGGDGTDKLLGGTGNDQLFGGPGDDGGTNGLLDGGDGNDWLFGESGADKLLGGADYDAMNGGTENDELDGGTGHDTLRGGPQNDVLTGNLGSDWITFGEAPGPVTADLVAGTATGEGSDTLSGIELLDGSAFGDTLAGDDGPNIIRGEQGPDTIFGNGGGDKLDGGLGDDPMIDGGAGADRLFGGPGTDKLVAGTEDDELLGGPGDDKPVTAGPTGGLEGGPGDDRLQGEAGNDKLDGGDGDDGLAGGDGDDELIGGLGSDIAAFFDSLSGVIASLADGTATGQGTDTLTGIEHLFGSPHNDSLTGNDAANSIFGDAGDDSLFGLAGPDFLDGGLNTDTIDGGTDADFDTCVNGETVTNCP